MYAIIFSVEKDERMEWERALLRTQANAADQAFPL